MSGKLAIVGGLERFAKVYYPVGVECDHCKEKLLPKNYISKDMRGIAQADFGWTYYEGEDLCPSCTKDL